MAARGRLSTPLLIRLDRLSQIPELPDVRVPMGPKDIRRALEFLQQAKLVVLRAKQGTFEVVLKEDRYIRLPQDSPIGGTGLDISTKILARWATHKVKKPIASAATRTNRARRNRDRYTRSLFVEPSS